MRSPSSMGNLKKNNETFVYNTAKYYWNREQNGINICKVDRKVDPQFTKSSFRIFKSYSKTLVLTQDLGRERGDLCAFYESLLLMLSLDLPLFFELHEYILGGINNLQIYKSTKQEMQSCRLIMEITGVIKCHILPLRWKEYRKL